MLPETEIIGDDAPESYVTEETYEVLRINLAGILAEKDDYLDVFIQDMVYSDQPIKKNISKTWQIFTRPSKISFSSSSWD